MERSVADNEERIKSKQGDLDLFASFMTEEMRLEMSRLYNEQITFRKEIEQLRQEREFLVDLLKKKEAIPQLTFASENLSIEGEAPKKLELETQTEEPEERPISFSASLYSIDQIQTLGFSKEKMMDEMRKYDNRTFSKGIEIVKHARNYDSIVKYIVNACGTKIDSMEKEIEILKNEIKRAQSKRRNSIADSVRSLTAAKTQ